MLNYAKFNFLHLGDTGLQSLSSEQPENEFRYIKPTLPQLANTSGLTRLELIRLDVCNFVTRVRGLPLRELILISCHATELQLFVPGAFTSLQKLHIEEGACEDVMQEDEDSATGNEELQLKDVGAMILDLPELRQVSGWCELYERGMREGLRSWGESFFPNRAMVSSNKRRHCYVSRMKMWTRN